MYDADTLLTIAFFAIVGLIVLPGLGLSLFLRGATREARQDVILGDEERAAWISDLQRIREKQGSPTPYLRLVHGNTRPS